VQSIIGAHRERDGMTEEKQEQEQPLPMAYTVTCEECFETTWMETTEFVDDEEEGGKIVCDRCAWKIRKEKKKGK
jgi:hypothetical protein